MNKKTTEYPISALREDLRCRANDRADRLRRSVARLTSCDRLPCMEYGEEVAVEHRLADQLFYLQHCRSALERCIGTGVASLRFRWADGSVAVTRFRMVGPSRVRVSGLEEGA